jgi:CheY-like chemotaxis protein
VARILVVDDDPHVRAIAADTLTLSGHEVDAAPDGVDALYLLKQHAYDIIMSDLRMPILDGPGLYRALQRHYAALLPARDLRDRPCRRGTLHDLSCPDGSPCPDETLHQKRTTALD